MRKFALIAAATLTGMLALTACSKQDDEQAATAQVQQVTKPTDPADTKAWSAYFQQIVQNNMQGMTADRPYPYLVPAGDSDDAKGSRDRQLQNVQDAVSRGVLPGNMMVFAGPNSAQTADLVIEAFKDAKPGSFKGVILLIIGDAADQQRVTEALNATGATVRYVTM
jgi:hypothetical protein